ncbi:hypothetical protein B0T19DRAFT_159788 [Cercophora scortea]|uniref:Uncharacterized protein n=1 Tax=Cercophora scortea TaxID=314031 RepID=A0AAE0ILW9_9PEZI|nr:hypothetical protein B0T19DRAFT_159788 [Cercophora scortea]
MTDRERREAGRQGGRERLRARSTTVGHPICYQLTAREPIGESFEARLKKALLRNLSLNHEPTPSLGRSMGLAGIAQVHHFPTTVLHLLPAIDQRYAGPQDHFQVLPLWSGWGRGGRGKGPSSSRSLFLVQSQKGSALVVGVSFYPSYLFSLVALCCGAERQSNQWTGLITKRGQRRRFLRKGWAGLLLIIHLFTSVTGCGLQITAAADLPYLPGLFHYQHRRGRRRLETASVASQEGQGTPCLPPSMYVL